MNNVSSRRHDAIKQWFLKLLFPISYWFNWVSGTTSKKKWFRFLPVPIVNCEWQNMNLNKDVLAHYWCWTDAASKQVHLCSLGTVFIHQSEEYLEYWSFLKELFWGQDRKRHTKGLHTSEGVQSGTYSDCCLHPCTLQLKCQKKCNFILCLQSLITSHDKVSDSYF